MEYYSAIKKNAFESDLMRWIKLGPIIQSEVSQKEKDIYCILTYVYIYAYTHTHTHMEFRKNGINDPTCRAAKETQI